MSIPTLLVYAFILFAWSRAVLRYRDRLISFSELLFWTAVWGAAAIVIYMPGLTGAIATKVGIGRGADVVVYSSVVLLFYLLFRLYIKVNMAEREITRLVRAFAIREED